MRILIALFLLAGMAWAGGAAAQSCSSIADPQARLQCFDRQAAPRAAPQQQRQADASCTPANPCTGPRGGRYYYTPSGNKRYLSRR